MYTCLVDGHRIAYRRSGSGPPLILVHGITTHSFLWNDVVPLLETRFDVIALDLLGCGASDMPTGVSFALKDHAERIARFATVLGLEQFHFAGHDLGGGIGQIMAVRHPHRIRSLALINCVAYDFWPVQPIIALRTPVVRQLLLASLDLGALRVIVRRGLHHKEKLTPERFAAFEGPLRTPEGRRAFAHFARCLDNTNLLEIEAELRALRIPVTIIWGMCDPYLTVAIPRKLRQEIPGSVLHELPTAGHFSPIDEPALIARHLVEALDDVVAV
jgi:pimeloyl-ACP methyl ester carboxylesterase